MEVKEAERMIIAKPIASRPNRSDFKSFSDLLEGSIDSSPPNICTESVVPAIRPKTVRFKPFIDRAPSTTTISSQVFLLLHSDIFLVSTSFEFRFRSLYNVQAEQFGVDVAISSDKVLKPTVVYKPQAKLVSKATVSLLANMGNFNRSNELSMQSMEAPIEYANQEQTGTRVRPNLHRTTPSHAETNHTSEHSKMGSRNMEEDPKALPTMMANNDRPPSYDGYNWRKYGQKHVKGSEYPRSYYKCTYPNCPVKKKVERSFDGQIAEIVYKGEHNHPKPQPPRRNSSQGLGFASDATGHNERNEGSDTRVENREEVVLSVPTTPCRGKGMPRFENVTIRAVNACGTSENSVGIGSECDEASKEGARDESRSKRKKNENQSTEVGISGEQNSNDSEIIGDGFHWRKYGQKVVKGNPYPRSYYRCTNPKCSVRKHVERASDDPKAFVTTYEGKHNHEMPHRNTNRAPVSYPDSSSPAIKDKR